MIFALSDAAWVGLGSIVAAVSGAMGMVYQAKFAADKAARISRLEADLEHLRAHDAEQVRARALAESRADRQDSASEDLRIEHEGLVRAFDAMIERVVLKHDHD